MHLSVKILANLNANLIRKSYYNLISVLFRFNISKESILFNINNVIDFSYFEIDINEMSNIIPKCILIRKYQNFELFKYSKHLLLSIYKSIIFFVDLFKI